MRMRDFMGVLVAMVADAVQFGTTVITLGADQFAVPAQVVFSAIVSLVLAMFMGPHPRLLPGVVLEFIPVTNVLPGFTGAAVWVAWQNRRHLKEG